jgi:uncharacterized protein YdhG (YjbR/CyaY superfamily)
MAKTDFRSVNEYIAAQPKSAQTVLLGVRRAIRKALPGAEEVLAYQIPAYRVQDVVALYFAGWKKHYSLYPAGDRLVAAFKEELAPYELSKGTIRFPLSAPIPAKLIAAIARFRAKEVRERVKANVAAKKRPTGKP